MALIRTIAEAKSAFPRGLSNLSSPQLLPDFEAAEIKYLVPLIGFAQYNAINNKINADPAEDLTDPEAALLPHLRRVSVFYAYLDNMGSDNAKITDNGIRSLETANAPRVFAWQYKELKNSLQTKVYDAIEVLLRFLFQNKADYALWTASDEYTALSGLIIKTGTDFNNHYKLFQPMRTFYSLKVLMDEVQEYFIGPAIGAELLAHYVGAENLDGDEKAILKLLKKATAYMVINKACQHYSVRFDANGFSILSGDQDNSETSGRAEADLNRFELTMQSCEKDAQAFLARAKKVMVDFRSATDNAPFIAAFDEGPLVDYVDPADKTRGNDSRKSFRF
jgi:hypothetical protein